MTIRIIAAPVTESDTMKVKAVKDILDGAESDVDTPDVRGARSLVRRALADVNWTAAAFSDGRICMSVRNGIVTVATWSTYPR